jgi:prevent-host-death family protein
VFDIKEKTTIAKTIDAHDARIHFGQLLDEVGKKDYTFFIKRRGKLAAVIINPEDYLDILEIEAELNDPEINKALMQSEEEFKIGEVGTEEDIFRILQER